MADFLYTTVPGKIKALLTKIKTVAVPPTASVVWLKSVGFTSSNDSSLLNVLQAAGLVDGSRKPTEAWGTFRGANGPKVLAEGLKAGYPTIFGVYPDAHLKSTNELEDVVRTGTKAGAQAVSKIVASFRALAAEADFNGVSAMVEEEEVGPVHAPIAEKRAQEPSRGMGPSLHIDMQVHISPDASAEQIDKIFESMAKHLYGTKS